MEKPIVGYGRVYSGDVYKELSNFNWLVYWLAY